MTWLILKLFIALGFEAYAVYLLLSSELHTVLIIILHVASSLLAASGFSMMLPDSIDERYLSHSALALVLILFMPAFGLIGVLFFLLTALWRPKEENRHLWQGVVVPELPFKPVNMEGKAVYGQGGLASVLSGSKAPERRISAVLAARQISDKLSIPLLQEALKDPVDDVRMFAYSLLDSKETEINERIASLLYELEGCEHEDVGRTQYTLAQNYWELVFLGLVTGNTLDYALDRAEQHAALAEQSGWTGSDIHFLIGRIYLRQEKYVQAEQALKASITQGAMASTVLPYLAEIAYEQRDFKRVRALLQQLQDCSEGNTPMPAVVEAWSFSS